MQTLNPPRHLQSPLHTINTLFKVSEQTMDVSQLSISSSSGRGVTQVMGYHQTFFKANLSTEHY